LKEISQTEYEQFLATNDMFIPQSFVLLAFEPMYIPKHGINPRFGEMI